MLQGVYLCLLDLGERGEGARGRKEYDAQLFPSLRLNLKLYEIWNMRSLQGKFLM